MLTITIPDTERWDERKQEFVYGKSFTLQLEHSLISISKWEANWNKPFLSKTGMTPEQIIDYVRCMTLTQNVPADVYDRLTLENFDEVAKYIDSPMTATWFNHNDEKGTINNEQVTSELIYYWMIALQIPFECQKWHLNRLLTLIRVCNIKNSPPKQMSKSEIARRNSELNARRRAAMQSKG